MHTALITGGSAGLGQALARDLAADGWHVVVDGRDAARLKQAVGNLDGTVTQVAGDVTDPAHRRALAAAVTAPGRLDLLVHNASTLGPTPLPPLAEVSPDDLDDVWLTNVAAPLALTQLLLPALRASAGVLVAISSDAAVEHYEGWGAYAASKAALDQVALTLGAKGALLVTPDGAWRARAPRVNAVSTVGAGDSFLGAMIWAQASGKSLQEAFRYGAAGGAAAVLAAGTELAHAAEVRRLFAQVVVEDITTQPVH